MRIVHVAIVLPLLTVAFPFACGPRTLGFLPPDDAGAESDVTAAPDQAATTFGGTTTSDAQGPLSVIQVDGGPSPSGLGGRQSSPGSGCTGDLQSVVDPNGQVVATCPPDQGCLAGACVPACAAAANNKGTMGCDFVQATPSVLPSTLPPCWAVFLANNCSKPANITRRNWHTNYPVPRVGRMPVAGQAEQQ